VGCTQNRASNVCTLEFHSSLNAMTALTISLDRSCDLTTWAGPEVLPVWNGRCMLLSRSQSAYQPRHAKSLLPGSLVFAQTICASHLSTARSFVGNFVHHQGRQQHDACCLTTRFQCLVQSVLRSCVRWAGCVKEL
jgi:hypothetical protein